MRLAALGIGVFLMTALPGCTPQPDAAGGGPAAAAALARLADDYWEYQMETSPTWATYLGDFRYDDRLEETGPEARARAAAKLAEFDRRLRLLPIAGLSEPDRVLEASWRSSSRAAWKSRATSSTSGRSIRWTGPRSVSSSSSISIRCELQRTSRISPRGSKPSRATSINTWET